MGSTRELNPCKHHYDISMSKRTRKPMLDLKETQRDPLTQSKISVVHQSQEEDCLNKVIERQEQQEGDIDHKSLKQLISGNEETSNATTSKSGRSSLGQHFTEEENQLQLVTKQKRGVEGLKLKGMVGHCVKTLSHFIKVKHLDSRSNIGSRKKPLLRLGK